MDHTADDRAYDLEIAHMERVRLMRGEESTFPSFATKPSELDELIEWGRVNVAWPDSFAEEPSDAELRQIEADQRCSSGLHPAGDVTSQGHCRGCKALKGRRKRAEANGRPLCWTGTHLEPGEDEVCACGQEPPTELWCDWAAIDAVIAGRVISRALTSAESVCAMRTVAKRRGLGMYEAATWLDRFTDLKVDARRAEYLLDEWQPRAKYVAKSVDELMGEEFSLDSQTAAETEAPAAA